MLHTPAMAYAGLFREGNLKDDDLKTRIGRRLRLSETAKAQRLQEARDPGRLRGRIVVIP